jgi:hypothetical protein
LREATCVVLLATRITSCGLLTGDVPFRQGARDEDVERAAFGVEET